MFLTNGVQTHGILRNTIQLQINWLQFCRYFYLHVIFVKSNSEFHEYCHYQIIYPITIKCCAYSYLSVCENLLGIWRISDNQKKNYLRVGGRLVYEWVKFLNIPCDWSVFLFCTDPYRCYWVWKYVFSIQHLCLLTSNGWSNQQLSTCWPPSCRYVSAGVPKAFTLIPCHLPSIL